MKQMIHLAIVAACSTAEVTESYPFIVYLTPQDSGLKKNCHVNLAYIMTIDKVHLKDKCGELSKSKMTEGNKATETNPGL
jgi:mRNA-degrading endonuclease toxin of MazEF toxin-antitoxin module